MALIADLVAKLKLDSREFTNGLAIAEGATTNFSRNAKLGLLAVATAISGAMVGAFYELKKIVSESTLRISDLVHASERLGIGAEGLERLDFAAKQAGVSAEQLNTLLKFMEKNVGNVGTGLAGAKLGKYFDEMGISVKNLLQLPVEKQFDVILDGLGKIENQDERAAAAVALFGRGGNAALQFVAEGTKNAEAQFDRLGIAISGKQAASIKNYGKDVKQLNAIWEGFQNQLTIAVIPALEKLITWIENTVVSMGGMGPIAKTVGEDIVAGFSVVAVVLKGINNAIDFVIIGFDALASTALQTIRIASLGLADLTTNISKTQAAFEQDAKDRFRDVAGLAPQREQQGADYFTPRTASFAAQQQAQKVEVTIHPAPGFNATVANSAENRAVIVQQTQATLNNASAAHQ